MIFTIHCNYLLQFNRQKGGVVWGDTTRQCTAQTSRFLFPPGKVVKFSIELSFRTVRNRHASGFSSKRRKIRPLIEVGGRFVL